MRTGRCVEGAHVEGEQQPGLAAGQCQCLIAPAELTRGERAVGALGPDRAVLREVLLARTVRLDLTTHRSHLPLPSSGTGPRSPRDPGRRRRSPRGAAGTTPADRSTP